jgi:hypothetical protein
METRAHRLVTSGLWTLPRPAIASLAGRAMTGSAARGGADGLACAVPCERAGAHMRRGGLDA